MTVKSWRGVAAGAFIALVVPIACLVLALVVQLGIVPQDQMHELLNPVFELSMVEIILAPVGIAIVGISAGLRGPIAWLGLIIVAVPLLAFIWFYCVATFSGALGDPF